MHSVNGLTSDGTEARIRVGLSYHAAKVTEESYAYKIAQRVVTFSDKHIQALQMINMKWANIMADREVLDRDSFVWNYPLASSYSSTQKATHNLTLSNVFSADVQSSVNRITTTMSYTI